MLNMVSFHYTNNIHLSHRQRTMASAAAFAGVVMQHLPFIRSVVDVGCGLGCWLDAFRQCGATTLIGYDGDYIDRSQLAIPADCFRAIPLDWKFDIEGHYDLAISMEVAEHLPPRSSQPLVASLCRAADVVLFSAAIPGQKGEHHINARPHRYWHDCFAAQGYVAYDFIRPLLWHREDLQLCYRQNGFVYVRETVLQQPAYAGLAGQPKANCLTLIEEDILVAESSPRAFLKRLLRLSR